MMIRLAATATVGVFLLAVAGWRQPAKVHDFSTLPQGNVLKVHYHSSGCFHQTDYEFTFRRSDGLFVDAVKDPRATPTFFAVKSLSADDIIRLDAMLHFYRQVKGDGCTTVDTVSFAEYQGSKVVATESYKDATCSAGDNPSLLTFSQLANKLKQTEPQP